MLKMPMKRPCYDSLSCDFKGCGAGPFKRYPDLERHQRNHSSKYRFECPAQGCRFIGEKAFPRKDKLREHILAGHNDETVFNCPDRLECVASITQDCLPLHSQSFGGLQKFRKCPLPRCSFKLNAERQSMDLLQQHLADKHDTQGRAKYSESLTQRGYDHATLEIVCPVCSNASRFKYHTDFYDHFLTTRLPGTLICLDCAEHGSVPKLDQGGDDWWHCRVHSKPAVTTPPREALHALSGRYGNRMVRDAFNTGGHLRLEHVPRQEHCRSLLSLWPDFMAHPLCNAFKDCVLEDEMAGAARFDYISAERGY